MDYEAFMRLVERRRSYWHFRSDPVPESSIEKIVEAARYAPSAFNSQPWEFVVLHEQGLRDAVVEIIGAAMPPPPPKPRSVPSSMASARPVKDPLGFRTAPVLLLVLGDTRVRNYGPPHLRSDDKAWHGALVTSLAVAYEHMHLAAVSLGLATRWVSAVSLDNIEPQIKQFLRLPPEMTVFDMMALGYSDFRPLAKEMRPLSEILHVGICGDGEFRTDTQVAEYFAGRPR